jgi:putative DNA-invertase from lambdoid prophage Rac
MRVALYARVSTTDQNCEMQLRELRAYCDRSGWEVVGEYVDRGWSGSKKSRPELTRLLKDAQQKQFQAVAVWKIDRFGRSVLNFVDHLQSLRSWGIRFLATSQNIDSDATNPTSQLIMHILIAVAEFERELIRERTKGGMMTAKKAGVHCGRPKAVVDRRRVRDMLTGGASHRQIAAKLGISKTAATRLIRSLAEGGPKG